MKGSHVINYVELFCILIGRDIFKLAKWNILIGWPKRLSWLLIPYSGSNPHTVMFSQNIFSVFLTFAIHRLSLIHLLRSIPIHQLMTISLSMNSSSHDRLTSTLINWHKITLDSYLFNPHDRFFTTKSMILIDLVVSPSPNSTQSVRDVLFSSLCRWSLLV